MGTRISVPIRSAGHEVASIRNLNPGSTNLHPQRQTTLREKDILYAYVVMFTLSPV